MRIVRASNMRNCWNNLTILCAEFFYECMNSLLRRIKTEKNQAIFVDLAMQLLLRLHSSQQRNRKQLSHKTKNEHLSAIFLFWDEKTCSSTQFNDYFQNAIFFYCQKRSQFCASAVELQLKDFLGVFSFCCLTVVTYDSVSFISMWRNDRKDH